MITSESGHWYREDGTPAYTIIGKNGNERPTTLRDARKERLLPSVTTIMSVMAKPGLERWKLNQVMQAALTLPPVPGETLDEFEARAWADSEEHGKQARETGTAIHGCIEGFYAGKFVGSNCMEHVMAVDSCLTNRYGLQKWLIEKSVTHPLGFGGKIDLHSARVVIDYKTKDFNTGDKLPVGYEENLMQLAAYRQCINPDAKCANLFISRTEPGLVHLHEWSDDDLDRGWEMFKHLFGFWKALKNYDPTK